METKNVQGKLEVKPDWIGTIRSKEDQKCLRHQIFLGQEMERPGKQGRASYAQFQAIFLRSIS